MYLISIYIYLCRCDTPSLFLRLINAKEATVTVVDMHIDNGVDRSNSNQ